VEPGVLFEVRGSLPLIRCFGLRRGLWPARPDARSAVEEEDGRDVDMTEQSVGYQGNRFDVVAGSWIEI